MKKSEILLAVYSDEEFLLADGFDEAILGICENSSRVIYSVRKCLEILQSQGMTEEDAMEHLSFNVTGAWVGEKTPIWCYDLCFESDNASSIL